MIPRPPLSFILDGSDMLIAGRSLPVFFARFSLLNQELKLLPQAIRAALARGILKLQESHLQPGATQAHNGSLGQPEVLGDFPRRRCPVSPEQIQQSSFPWIQLSQLSRPVRRAPLRRLCRLRAHGA